MNQSFKQYFDFSQYTTTGHTATIGKSACTVIACTSLLTFLQSPVVTRDTVQAAVREGVEIHHRRFVNPDAHTSYNDILANAPEIGQRLDTVKEYCCLMEPSVLRIFPPLNQVLLKIDQKIRRKQIPLGISDYVHWLYYCCLWI